MIDRFFVLCFFCVKAATDHGHIFWIQDGSIRSDISLEESITVDLHLLKNNISNEHSSPHSMVSTPSPATKPVENGVIYFYFYFCISFILFRSD